jgi:transcriptional regulator GlxA family with amidase domain
VTGVANHIGILLFDDVEELDAVGPWEVFSHWTRSYPEDGWAVCLLSPGGRPVTAAKGMVIGGQHAMDTGPPLQVLVHPGGRGTRRLMGDEEHLAWVRNQRERVPLMASVCTGALVYAAAGLLRGRPATTYWNAFEELAAADPSVQLRPGERYVDDGDILTSAGVSAGIDMALHLVTRLAGAERASQVRRGIEYVPESNDPASPSASGA